ncbi:hypothetical protein [Ornithobacterium rhinotracheale]
MTKVKEINEIVRICEQKKQTGDYQTLAKALGTTIDAARMRFYRKDENAVRVLHRIIEQRESLTQEFQKQ